MNSQDDKYNKSTTVVLDAYVRRDKRSKAVITGSGVIAFNDGSTNTWNCGFDAGALNMT
jgi:hypothetical protein